MSLSTETDVGRTTLVDPCADRIAQLLFRAYAKLVFTARNPAGPRTVIVAQFGSLEVRLNELADAFKSQATPPLWVEIYSHANGSVTDSYGMFDFNEDELSQAVELIALSYLDAHCRQDLCRMRLQVSRSGHIHA